MANEMSKAQKLAEAAKLRHKVEEEAAASSAPSGSMTAKVDEDVVEGKKEAAEELVRVRPQAVDKSLTGELDVEAMGDVKGDGGDAKDYDDGDPAKALGVPVYEHGLAEHNADLDAGKRAALMGNQISERTRAEQERGQKALSNRRDADTSTKRATRTVVTDADEDPDGDKGKTKAEKAAEEAKRKVAEKEASSNK